MATKFYTIRSGSVSSGGDSSAITCSFKRAGVVKGVAFSSYDSSDALKNHVASVKIDIGGERQFADDGRGAASFVPGSVFSPNGISEYPVNLPVDPSTQVWTCTFRNNGSTALNCCLTLRIEEE